MKKRILKLIALILSITLILSCVPVSAYATDTDIFTEENISYQSQDEQVTIISEIPEERTSDTKVFRLSDGSYMTAVYPQQIHYEENGKWENINNRLTDSSDEDGETVIENTNNVFKIKFSNKAKDKKLVSLKKDSYQLNWALYDSNKVDAQTINLDTSSTQMSSLNNLTGVVKYENILTDTDLKYTVSSTNIKEDIILNSINAPTSFTFEYEFKNLSYIINDDESITICNKDNVEDIIFTIDKPFMYDANGNYSDLVDLQVTETKNGIQVIISADTEWLGSDDRAFPVTIDPTIITEQSSGTVKDTTGVFAYKTDELENALELNNNYQYLKVGKMYGSSVYSLIYVPMPDNISDSCRLIEAKMHLYCYRAGISTCNSNLTISAHEIETDWNQTVISDNSVLYYDDIPEYNYETLDFMVLNDSSSDVDGEYYSFDITKAAQKWATGESVNRGILLQGEISDIANKYMRFYDSDNSVANSDPCFTYTYRDTKGIEDYWTYTSLSAGRSGTAAVNNFNGNLVVAQSITGISGNRLPVSISVMYDSSSRNDNTYNLGNGWKTNYDMKIYTSSLNGFPYYLIDSDGTEHYFFGETTDSEWKDEDGLGYTLKKDSTVYTDGYLITDKSKNKNYFRSDGKLGRIEDTFGNQLNLSYTSAGKISAITDGSGRVYTFAYNTSGNISTITNPANKVVTFSYTTSGNLEKITYQDNKSTTFEYGTNGLSKTISADGTYTSYTYNFVNNHLYTTSIEFYGSNNTLNTDYDFLYKHNNTVITSNCDNTVNHTYQFDNFGKTIGVVNNISETAEYYSYGAPGGSNGTENKLLSASNTVQASATLINDNNLTDYSKWYKDPNSTDTTVTVDSTKGRNSAPSLKVEQTNEYGGESAVIYDIGVLKGGYNHCIKLHVNTNGVIMNSGYGIYFYVYSLDSDGNRYTEAVSNSIIESFDDSWVVLSATVGNTEDKHYYVSTGCYFSSPGTFWVDDCQVELGYGTESYNYVSDSLFYNEGQYWQYKRNDSVATDASVEYVANGSCWIDGAYNEKRSCSQVTDCTGKSGDVLCFGAWALGKSVPTGITKEGVADKSTFRLRIELKGSSGTAVFTDNSNVIDFNYAVEDWQFGSGYVIAPIDFTEVIIYFDYDYNMNYAAFHTPFIYKEEFGQSYTYDNDGNVVSTKDLAETEANFAYQNDNLEQMVNPTGSRYSYAYDEETNALLYANSSYGQLYAFTYDEYGNVLSSNVTASANSTQVSDGNTYYIRNVATGNAMKSNGSALVNGTYAAQNNTIRWKLISAGETDIYYIQPLSDSSKYLTVKDSSADDKAELILSDIANSDNQKFKIECLSDGTFKILTKVSNYQKVIDSRDLNSSNSTQLNKGMVQNTFDNTVGYQKWYFTAYASTNNSQTSINASSAYTSDGNYVKTDVDTFNNVTSYEYNTDGSVKSVTDSKNVTTDYTYYSDSGNLKTVTSANSTNTYTYENDRLKTITTANGTVYTFNYDSYGRNTSIDLNRVNSTSAARRLISYKYNSDNYQEGFTFGSNNNIAEVIYGNGASYTRFYDNLGRLNNIYKSELTANYSYNKNGLLSKKSLSSNMEVGTTNYTYDLSGRIVNKIFSNDFDSSVMYSVSYNYLDKKNLLEKYRFATPYYSLTTGFEYGNINNGEIPDAIYGVKLNNILRLGYNYDDFARKNSRTLYTDSNNITTTYGYKSSGDNKSSYLVDTVTENGFTYNYTYDSLGNITAYTKTNNTTNQVVENYIYQYDSKNQLIYVGTSETNGTEYTYDANGNILTKTDRATNSTVSYAYNDATWADLLTSYNGQNITYDAIGNPLSYRDGMSFTWIEGRTLSTVTKGSATYTYSYNGDGDRLSKSVGETFTKYFIFDGVMYGEVRYDSVGATEIYYFYDDNDTIYGLSVNGVNYYYRFNLQGDVTGIYDSNGNLVVEYAYDAWGKVLSVTGNEANTIGQINPIRYRGYYYDTETGFYYCISRYYDPEIGRFINADGYLSTGQGIISTNMFAYCGNNPVNRADPTGAFWKKIGNWLEDAWDDVKSTFGAGATMVHEAIQEIELSPPFANLFVTVKSGTKESKTVSSTGNSSKPISVYAQGRSDNYLLSSAGLKINIVNFSIDISLGLDNTGISGSIKNGDTTHSLGVNANLSQLKVGFEGSTTVQWDEDKRVSTYTNASITGMGILSMYFFATTGQFYPSQQPSY